MTTGDTTRGGGEVLPQLPNLLCPGPSSPHPHPGPGDTGVTARQDMPSQVEGTKGIFRQCARARPRPLPPSFPPPWSPPGEGLGHRVPRHCVPRHRAEPSPACPLHSGFECITYPLLGPTSGRPEPRAAPAAADSDSPLPTGDQEAALASDALCGQEDTSSDLPSEWT